ncbi:HalOD1 output domain-containing protein [Halorientalis salina]|uniref:HalOD1 output domain-containing protein n=1 Tax=Halorientalis salina TaxID=2932266 RepID=UPI00145D3D23|nr:HalOD1 output domain-containing protein [Halorientalis salina]
MTGRYVGTDGDDRCRTEVRDEELVCEAVVRLVSTVDGTDPLDLPPLGRILDTDAIDAVFEPVPGSTRMTTRTLTFTYHGYTVTVEGTGTEQVCLLREA